jgi:hypothetical protein
VRQIGRKLGLPAKGPTRKANAAANAAAAAAGKQAKIDRDQKLVAELRKLVEVRGLSIREAVRQLVGAGQGPYQRLLRKAQRAGIVSMFGRWPANKARAKALGFNGRVPTPWHSSRKRKR